MNKLSWLIYFGDLSSNIKAVFITLAIISFLISLAVILYGADMKVYANPEGETWKRGHGFQICGLKWMALPAILLVVFAALPSRNTFYFIAASEIGEEAIQTETADKMVAAINRVLDKIGVEEKE